MIIMPSSTYPVLLSMFHLLGALSSHLVLMNVGDIWSWYPPQVKLGQVIRACRNTLENEASWNMIIIGVRRQSWCSLSIAPPGTWRRSPWRWRPAARRYPSRSKTDPNMSFHSVLHYTQCASWLNTESVTDHAVEDNQLVETYFLVRK